jgi:hypothetical protein
MIKLITNQCQGNKNDYLEISEFEDEINNFLRLNPSYKLKKIIYKDELELLAHLEQTEKQIVNQEDKKNLTYTKNEAQKKLLELMREAATASIEMVESLQRVIDQ